MKLSFYGFSLQLILLNVLLAGSAIGQKNQSVKEVFIDLQLKNASIVKAFNTIESKTKYKFNYNKPELDKRIQLNINSNNSSVAEVLMTISRQTGLKFRQVNESINVDKLMGTDDLEVGVIYAEDVEITGKITDENGEGLPGASVVVKGTATGTTTDLDGKYKLSVPEQSTIVVSFVGYVSSEILIEGQSVIDVQMELDAEQLEEVVVVGYGVEKKVNLTGSVGTVENKDLTLIPTANSTGLLTGRIPGIITKQGSGLPGAENVNISIRGFGDPLILVDGVQLAGGFTRIDPNEIESISVLKDAAAAVYGARAGNGVILVTTKRGKAGESKISYSGSLTLQEATAIQEYVNPGQYVELVREADFNDNGDFDLTFSEDDLQNYRSGAPGYEGGDWIDALIDNFAPMTQHNLNVSGGAENVRYFASVGTTKQESYFAARDHDYQRHNVRTNIDVDVNKNFSFNLDLSYRRDSRNTANSINGIFNDLATAQPIYPTTLPDSDIGVPYSGFSQRNPVGTSKQSVFGWNKRRDNTIQGKLGVKYKVPFIEGLSLRAELNAVQLNRSTKAFRNRYQVFQYDPTSDEYIDQGYNTPRTTISDQQFRREQVYPLFAMEYQKSFGDHYLKVLGLTEQLTRQESFLSASRTDLISSSLTDIFSGSTEFDETGGSSNSDMGRKSYVGRFNYRFRERYLLEATFRADGNVRFSPQKRWGYFPSVSLGWILSEEGFMQGTGNVVNTLKLRASYTELGYDEADGILGFDYLAGYSPQSAYLLGGQLNTSIRTLGLANPLLGWEETTTYNLGIEAAFLEGRLQMETDLFFRKREGILRQSIQSIPSTFGGDLPLVNLNSQNNRGIEVKLAYQQRIGQVKLNISPNMTFARAKHVDVLDQEEFTDPDQLRINGRSGQWVNRNFGYVSDGIFMSQQEIDEYPVAQDEADPSVRNSTIRPGDIRFVDLDGNDTINFRDQKQIAFANGLPEFIWGMSIGASYKGFNLNLLFQGASRYSINITGAARAMFSNSSTPYSYHYDLRWQPDPNDPSVNINPNAELPAAATTTSPNNGRNSDFYRKNVSYVRLRSINLSYDLPKNISSKAGLDYAQFYVAAENLFTLSNLGFYKNSFDPESAGTNPSRTFPISRSFTVGLRVSF
ncbi:MAG: TonB-dependent receptor [Cyclobacteriaceae bacterium]